MKGGGDDDGGARGDDAEGLHFPPLPLQGNHLVLELWHYLDWHFHQEQHWWTEARRKCQKFHPRSF